MGMNDILDKLNDVEINKVDTLKNIEMTFEEFGHIEPRLNNKRYIIKYAEEHGVDCSIFKKGIPHKVANFYLDLLKQGKNIGLFASTDYKLPELRIIAKELFDANKYSDEDFEYSTPHGVCTALIYFKMLNYDFGENNKCLMNLRYYQLFDILKENEELISKYLIQFIDSEYKDFFYVCLLDSLLHCTKEEKEELDDIILSNDYPLQIKCLYTTKFLKPTIEGMKNVLDFIRFHVDCIVMLPLTDKDKVLRLPDYYILPFIPTALIELMNKDNNFLRDGSEDDSLLNELISRGFVDDDAMQQLNERGFIKSSEL